MGLTPQRIRRQRFRLAATAIFVGCVAVAIGAIPAVSYLWELLFG